MDLLQRKRPHRPADAPRSRGRGPAQGIALGLLLALPLWLALLYGVDRLLGRF